MLPESPSSSNLLESSPNSNVEVGQKICAVPSKINNRKLEKAGPSRQQICLGIPFPLLVSLES